MAGPARPEAIGASQAARCFTATARSMPIRVPMKAQIISAACSSAARPGHIAASTVGTATPARISPPAMPASKAVATRASSDEAAGITSP